MRDDLDVLPGAEGIADSLRSRDVVCHQHPAHTCQRYRCKAIKPSAELMRMDLVNCPNDRIPETASYDETQPKERESQPGEGLCQASWPAAVAVVRLRPVEVEYVHRVASTPQPE